MQPVKNILNIYSLLECLELKKEFANPHFLSSNCTKHDRMFLRTKHILKIKQIMTTWRLTYLGIERSKVILRHSAASSVFSSKSVLYKEEHNARFIHVQVNSTNRSWNKQQLHRKKMMVHWLNKIVNSGYFEIKIFNWLPRLKLMEKDCWDIQGLPLWPATPWIEYAPNADKSLQPSHSYQFQAYNSYM